MDKDIPLWKRIAADLAEGISGGRWSEGAFLPPEQTLADGYGAKRHTVRRALAHLADEGLVETRPGSGTRVRRPRIEYALGRRIRFGDTMRRLDLTAQTRILGSRTVAATSAMARTLMIRAGEPVSVIEALRSADGVPLTVARHHLAKSRFPDFIQIYRAAGSLTQAFARFGVTDYRRRHTRLFAQIPPGRILRLLDLPAPCPFIVTQGVDVDTEQMPIQLVVTWFSPDRIDIVLDEPA
jgi:GntR family phosphonate transport system transcriptional regulator